MRFGLGFFSLCMGRVDRNQDGRISADEVLVEGVLVVVKLKEVTYVVETILGGVEKVSGVDVREALAILKRVDTALDSAKTILQGLEGFPFPKNLTELKALVDKNGDGHFSSEEILDFTRRMNAVFDKAIEICKANQRDPAPIEKCKNEANNLVHVLAAINQLVEARRSSKAA